jgi:ABC-type antimicrobial peptide transport system permease subunit
VVSDSDLLVLAPWAVFIAGVALLVLLAVTRSHGGERRNGRRRSRSRRR